MLFAKCWPFCSGLNVLVIKPVEENNDIAQDFRAPS